MEGIGLIQDLAIVLLAAVAARAGSSLARGAFLLGASVLELSLRTGVRVVARERQGERVLAPGGGETLAAGDLVLVAGTLAEIGAFRRWLAAGGPVEEAA